MNHQRIMEGIAAAKAKGGGSEESRSSVPAAFETVLRQWAAREIYECEAARCLGVSRPTFHNSY